MYFFFFLFLCATMTLAQISGVNGLFICSIPGNFQDMDILNRFEVLSSVLTLIIWLSYRYGKTVLELYSQHYRISTEN